MNTSNHLVSIMCALFVCVSCSFPKVEAAVGHEALSGQSSDESILTFDAVKLMVEEEIKGRASMRSYYTEGSPDFDERVFSLTWGEPVLVHAIADGKFIVKDSYYYVVTGIMPDGQVLAGMSVDAHTGELMDGVACFDEDSSIMRIASENEAVQAARSRGLIGAEECSVSAIFHLDYGSFSYMRFVDWNYLIQPKGADVASRGFTGADYVLVEPWICDFKQDDSVRSDNTSMSFMGYDHRFFRVDAGSGSKGDGPGFKFVPID